ncbi:unnamed protein product [Moneuplotes crassus]|uniref:Uncharacterized protein n=1 Tax=Euplotes crassus TaxID=5936 RepID=A0AAD2D3C8_EUPCR|nr:unnamed protein product [Moneuplotes crassus]
MNKRVKLALVVLFLLLVTETVARRSSSRSSYSRRSRTSYRSGSRSSGQCKGSTMRCVVIPLCCIAGFIFIILVVMGIFAMIKYCKERHQERNYENSQKHFQKIKDLEKQQKEEASKLQKLQQEQEKKMKDQLYMNQVDYSSDLEPNNQFVVPGVAVQPSYNIVNPYYRSHDPEPVPLIYYPAAYGLTYDNNEATGPHKMMPESSNSMAGAKGSGGDELYLNQIRLDNKADKTHEQLM